VVFGTTLVSAPTVLGMTVNKDLFNFIAGVYPPYGLAIDGSEL